MGGDSKSAARRPSSLETFRQSQSPRGRGDLERGSISRNELDRRQPQLSRSPADFADGGICNLQGAASAGSERSGGGPSQKPFPAFLSRRRGAGMLRFPAGFFGLFRRF